jgi:ribosomal protein L14
MRKEGKTHEIRRQDGLELRFENTGRGIVQLKTANNCDAAREIVGGHRGQLEEERR